MHFGICVSVITTGDDEINRGIKLSVTSDTLPIVATDMSPSLRDAPCKDSLACLCAEKSEVNV